MMKKNAMMMFTKTIKSIFCRDSIIYMLFTENVNEPLYFVKLVEKSVATEDLKDLYGRVICTGELYSENN